MYNIVKTVIAAGGYKLADIQHKIKKLYTVGDLSDAQMDELLALAAEGVNADAERPGLIAMVQTLRGEIEDLQKRVAALEGGSDTDAGADDYPAWKAWDGISADYQEGAIVTHNGELWQSTYSGQNVWEPGASGTGALWKKYKQK